MVDAVFGCPTPAETQVQTFRAEGNALGVLLELTFICSFGKLFRRSFIKMAEHQGGTSNGRFRLLDLPREVRDLIYSDLLEVGEIAISPKQLELLGKQRRHQRWYHENSMSRSKWTEACRCSPGLFQNGHHLVKKKNAGNTDSNIQEEDADDDFHHIVYTYECGSAQGLKTAFISLNRQVCDEATDTFYAKNSFVVPRESSYLYVNNSEMLNADVKDRPDSSRFKIRSAKFDLQLRDWNEGFSDFWLANSSYAN